MYLYSNSNTNYITEMTALVIHNGQLDETTYERIQELRMSVELEVTTTGLHTFNCKNQINTPRTEKERFAYQNTISATP